MKGIRGFINCPMKTLYSISVLFLIVLCVFYKQKEVKEKRFRFIEMSERLLSVTGNKSETFVVVNGVGGGLGHKYRSTEMEVTYALIARKRLYCVC